MNDLTVSPAAGAPATPLKLRWFAIQPNHFSPVTRYVITDDANPEINTYATAPDEATAREIVRVGNGGQK
jgi:hypothetical protein